MVFEVFGTKYYKKCILFKYSHKGSMYPSSNNWSWFIIHSSNLYEIILNASISNTKNSEPGPWYLGVIGSIRDNMAIRW